MQTFIKLSEAIQTIYSGELIDLEFVTCDVKRGTGGDLITVTGWQLTGYDGKGKTAGGHRQASQQIKRPNHDQHDTFVIYNPDNKKLHPYTVHIKLIQSLNGKTILHG